MPLSAVYIAFQRVLQLVLLLFRSTEFKELEIVVLRHELAVPRRQRSGSLNFLVRSAGTLSNSWPALRRSLRSSLLPHLVTERHHAALVCGRF